MFLSISDTASHNGEEIAVDIGRSYVRGQAGWLHDSTSVVGYVPGHDPNTLVLHGLR